MNFFDVLFNEETQFSLMIFYSIFNQTCTFFFKFSTVKGGEFHFLSQTAKG